MAIDNELVYKYIKVDGVSYQKFLEGKITFCDIDCFNDPFEGNFNFDLPQDFVPQKNDRNITWIRQQAVTALKNKCHSNFRIVCFTKSHDKPVMWSHYAGVYNGICVAYKKEDIINAVNDKLFSAKDVKYLPETLSIQTITLDDTMNRRFERSVIDRNSINDNEVEQVLFTKAQEWSYEEEWRVVIKVDKEKIENDKYRQQEDHNKYHYLRESPNIEKREFKSTLFRIPKYIEYDCPPTEIYFFGNPVKSQHYYDEIKARHPKTLLREMYPDSLSFKFSVNK
jgi:hypothetical protein